MRERAALWKVTGEGGRSEPRPDAKQMLVGSQGGSRASVYAGFDRQAPHLTKLRCNRGVWTERVVDQVAGDCVPSWEIRHVIDWGDWEVICTLQLSSPVFLTSSHYCSLCVIMLASAYFPLVLFQHSFWPVSGALYELRFTLRYCRDLCSHQKNEDTWNDPQSRRVLWP